ncbi:MAG: bile acid:sodium symporter, partial [Pseudomonadota bacterium]
MRKLFSLFLTLFPLWVILAAIAGLSNPELLTSMSAWIVPLLVGVMLCMGLTLSINDFIKISQHKG